MKQLFHDKLYLCLQGAAVVLTLVYLLYSRGYQHTPVWASWLAAMALFAGTVLYSAVRKRWIATSINLAAAILLFLSLMILPYSI